jgi:DNA-binding response OmpR family regulator
MVEDEKPLRDIVSRRLKAEGYSVDTASDGESGLYYAKMADYDLIVLDLMLPKIDGVTVLKRLRGEKVSTPVLVLTAKDSVADRVSGLDAGADDYVTKPFSLEEFLARTRALLRRNVENKENILVEADLVIDTLSHKATRAGKDITLTSKEYAVLEFMMRNKGRILSRDQIINHAWDFDFDSESNIINVYMRYLRGKIDDGFESKLLHTVRGSGYVLEQRK